MYSYTNSCLCSLVCAVLLHLRLSHIATQLRSQLATQPLNLTSVLLQLQLIIELQYLSMYRDLQLYGEYCQGAHSCRNNIRMASHLARFPRILQVNDIYANLDARMRIIVICHSQGTIAIYYVHVRIWSIKQQLSDTSNPDIHNFTLKISEGLKFVTMYRVQDYIIDIKPMGSTEFRNSKALGCGVRAKRGR